MHDRLGLLLFTLLIGSNTVAEELTPRPGALEVIAEIPVNPGNLAVTAQGRVFAVATISQHLLWSTSAVAPRAVS